MWGCGGGGVSCAALVWFVVLAAVFSKRLHPLRKKLGMWPIGTGACIQRRTRCFLLGRGTCYWWKQSGGTGRKTMPFMRLSGGIRPCIWPPGSGQNLGVPPHPSAKPVDHTRIPVGSIGCRKWWAVVLGGVQCPHKSRSQPSACAVEGGHESVVHYKAGS